MAVEPAGTAAKGSGALMIRAVLFDLDDTLFDHRYGARQALAAVRASHQGLASVAQEELDLRHGAILEELHLRVLSGELPLDAARRDRFRRLFLTAGVPAGADLVEAAAETYRGRYMESWQEVAGATALLRALRPRLRLGIVSNNLTREQHDKLRFCGFLDHLDAIVISEEAGVAKPDPGIFRIALQRIGADAHEAVMIGDAWATDIAGARAAGLRAIWYNPTGKSRPEPAIEVDEIRSLEPAEVLRTVFRGAEEAER
jgi:HAD superfamily hydrolase (TIGR01549 family)